MKKALSWILTLCLVLTLLPAKASASSALSVNVSISVQKDGQNILYAPYYYQGWDQPEGPALLTVYSDAAESMGYTDSISQNSGVSLLDVLVTAHRVFYNKTTDTTARDNNYDATKVFNKSNCSQYLQITNELRPTSTEKKDFVTRLFGYEVASDVDWVFTVNGVRPNEGIYPCGAAYAYTSVTTTTMHTNDNVAFYIPSDATYTKSNDTIKYGAKNDKDSGVYQYNLAAGSKAADGKYQDQYVWLENNSGLSDMISSPMKKDLTLTVKGFPYLTTYGKYGTFADYQAIAKPVSGVKIGLLDTNGKSPYNNGKVTQLGSDVSDADGKITISKDESVMQTAGTYTLVAYRTAADGAPVLMRLSTLRTSKTGLDPSLDGYVAPASLTVTTDESKLTQGVNSSGQKQLLFVTSAKNGNHVKFTALDQNGQESPVIWSSSREDEGCVFEDAYDGTLTIPNYTSSGCGDDFVVDVTATSRLNGETAKYRLYTGTAKMSLDIEPGNLTGTPLASSSTGILYPQVYANYGLLDYTIADPSIFEITNGIKCTGDGCQYVNYKFKRPGSTTLTIYEKANPYHCSVIPITVTGVVIESENGVSGSDNVYINKDLQLKTYVADPNNTSIAWSSSNEVAATVDQNGKVTGLTAGVTTITATCTTNGGTPYSGTIKILVRDAAVGGLNSLMISGPVSSTEQNSAYYDSSTGFTVTPSGMDSSLIPFEGDSGAHYGVTYTDCYETGKDVTFYINRDRDYILTGSQRVYLQPSFDPTTEKAELTVNGGQAKELSSDKSEQVSLIPGTNNVILVRASSRSDPDNYKDYKFTIVFPESTDGDFRPKSYYFLQSPDREMTSTLNYNGETEGRIFQLDDSGALKGTGSSAKMKAFVYRDIKQVSLCFQGVDAGYAHLRYKVDGGDYVECQGVIDPGPLKFGDSNQIVLTVQGLSDKIYRSYTTGDPWSDSAVITETFTAVRLDVDPAMSDFVVSGLKYSKESLTAPGASLSMNNPSQAVVISKDAASVTASFKVPDGMTPTVSGATGTLSGPDADGYYSFTVDTSSGNAFAETVKLSKMIDGYALAPTNPFTITFSKTDTSAYSAYLPDSVSDYLCVGSQYANGALSKDNVIGSNPERTLLGIANGSNQICLGSFGGYATYYFHNPITNDPKNPYGVDFTVYGYGTSGSDAARSKPGAVYVSQDGKTWYELAGSEHYDSNAVWGYKATYTNNGSGKPVSFVDNHGRSGSLGSGSVPYGYPSPLGYMLHNWTEPEKTSISFTGTLLLGSNGWNYAESGTAAPTKWGYAGTKITPSIVSTDDLTMMTGNPYDATYQGSGSGFDLSWAVDDKGNPVSLSSVNYVKVMSSSMIHANDANETSTVVYSVAKSAPFSDDNGKTSAPTSIKIGDKELKLEDGKYSYEAELSTKNFTVSVGAPSTANVYINDLRADTRDYTASAPFDFNKGILRIVVQENESAPLIYYVKLTTTEKDSGSIPSGGISTSGSTPETSGGTATATVEAKTDASGKAVASITAAQVDSAITAANHAAESTGKPPRIKFKAEGAESSKSVETTIPQASLSSLVSGGIDAITVSAPVASLTFDKNAIQTISTAAKGDVAVSAAKLDTSDLSRSVQDKVNGRPVYEFKVQSNGQTISQLNGTATVAIPYTLGAEEDPNAIVIYWINDAGELETVSNAHYDMATGTVVLATNHFSRFAVGYNKVNFSDVASNAWYYNAVSFIAARGITTGTDATSFSPDAALTRGQFITLLLRAYGISPDNNPADNFSDAGNSYYTGYIAAAKRLGISSGVGDNKFEPEKAVTRQELFTLQYNALKKTGKLPSGNSDQTLSGFTDSKEISSWAQEAMAYFVKAGIISGSNGKLTPSDETTRAQMAQVLYNLLVL